MRRCCSARGLRADRRDKLLKWIDTGGQNCTPNNSLNSGGKCAGLVKAAIKQCAVEIEVVAKCKNCPCKGCKKPQWSLRAITIPAGARTK